MAFLEIADVTKKFGGLVAVNAISFSVEKGEIVGIIGPNGAGKTTLFGVISGFMAPTSGDVRFDGASITGVSPDRLVRRGLMRSFQIVQSFADMTTLDVVTTAALTRRPMREAVDYAAETLQRVGLGGKELMTPLTLSLQDKKLLELAKCIATDPRCILLDEVMAGLTMAETAAPIAIIEELNRQGVTIVMVEHVMPVIMRLARRMVVINFGEKIAEGTPDEIIRDQRVIDAYFGDHIDA
ncbi:ABC transporter ATP-binding protein [Rhodopseudomonas sp. P2A-2r]|uniref:ABC transporter ATP-binding protein n=1 Tax=unclassified Rhodopseudomonas TaxID=2638247 RepID=UPI002234CE16|nr:ABC transporter ATP-binding protein [Rhodopseudomonas sp. P2A-2r]UZE49594.1 ABC transporter ATP-binding protein [Rhodopseudomonas sp. P2A-2r]